MFADYCILFCRATKKAAQTIKHALAHYCAVLGQPVNYHKSKVQFSKGVLNADRKEILQILQIAPTSNIRTYLRCINIDSTKRTKQDFDDIKHRIGQKLTGLQARTLPAAGKVVLIISNLTCIPQYSMIRFKILKNICKETDSLNRKFFWKDNCDHSDDNHGLHTFAWDKICRPKCEGGLDIRRTKYVNAASSARLKSSHTA